MQTSLQKPTLDMTLREIRDYVSPHLDPKRRDEDHQQLSADLREVVGWLGENKMQSDADMLIGLLEDYIDTVGESLEKILECGDIQESFAIAEELKGSIELKDLREAKEVFERNHLS